MVVEALAAGALISTFRAANEAAKLDDRALQKYARAFEKNKEAAMMVEKQAEYMDKRLKNVAKKKRAVIQDTVPKFAEIYGQIQKVNIRCSGTSAELPAWVSPEQLTRIGALPISVKREFTDKELVCGLLVKGLNKMMIQDSERFLSAANNQLHVAEAVYAQAESICVVYDAVVARADRIAKLLAGMNFLFLKSIEKAGETIERNGYDVSNYTGFDREVLMTCVNFAAAMADLIHIPVVDEGGRIAEGALSAIETGEAYLQKMNEILGEADGPNH